LIFSTIELGEDVRCKSFRLASPPIYLLRLMQVGMSLSFTEKPILGYNAKLKGGRL